MTKFLHAAITEAKQSLTEGGIPIGSVLVIDDKIIGHGHNRRVQKGSPTLHAEIDAVENAGRRTANEYQRSTLYTTLSPCDMCSGMVLLYKIPRVVIRENVTFRGPEDYLLSRGVELEVLNDTPRTGLMNTFFIQSNTLCIHAGSDHLIEDTGEAAHPLPTQPGAGILCP